MTSRLQGGTIVKNLFWLELQEDEVVANQEPAVHVEEQHEISLNSMIGISTMQNMLLEETLRDVLVQAISYKDLGSIHIFMNEKVIQRLKLPMINQDGWSVRRLKVEVNVRKFLFNFIKFLH